MRWFGALDSLVIGPGLGRDPKAISLCKKVLLAAKEASLPVVIDADGLRLVHEDAKILDGCGNAVITPNTVEFARLQKAMGLEVPSPEDWIPAGLPQHPEYLFFC